jgi:hypothetical protein
MVTTELKGKVLYFMLEGAFSAVELNAESEKWHAEHHEKFVGYVLDITHMTSHPALEQRKAEAFRKKLETKKPTAIVGKGEDGERFTKIYIRFTKAEKLQFFHTYEEAESWILSQE